MHLLPLTPLLPPHPPSRLQWELASLKGGAASGGAASPGGASPAGSNPAANGGAQADLFGNPVGGEDAFGGAPAAPAEAV